VPVQAFVVVQRGDVARDGVLTVGGDHGDGGPCVIFFEFLNKNSDFFLEFS
jgi:hypothetical protein